MIAFLTSVLVPVAAGVVAAGLTLTTVISAQTGAPRVNPADQPIIVYGSRG